MYAVLRLWNELEQRYQIKIRAKKISMQREVVSEFRIHDIGITLLHLNRIALILPLRQGPLSYLYKVCAQIFFI